MHIDPYIPITFRRLWTGLILILLLVVGLHAFTVWWLTRPAQWISVIEQAVARQVYAGPHGLDENWRLTTDIMDKVLKTQAELTEVREHVRDIATTQRGNVDKIIELQRRLESRKDSR